MAAFQVCIFKEDHTRLIAEYARGKGGSLFGLWKSNANPVIYVVFSASVAWRAELGKSLADNYGLCHIGEWRSVITEENYGGECDCQKKARQTLLPKYGEQQETPSRFLVLDVSRTGIIPFFFHKQNPEGKGTLEILSGENPFNHALKNPPLTENHDPPAYHQSAASGHVRRSQLDSSRSHCQREAEIQSFQWYASEGGDKALQFVYKGFQNIARSGQVEMSRETETHSMSMSFTDQYSGRKWEVTFPFNFPRGGAIMVETSKSTITGHVSTVEHRQPDQNEPGREDNVQKAVERMIRFIKQRH